jgi:hypothetical protein
MDRGSKYHGKEVQYTLGRVIDIPWWTPYPWYIEPLIHGISNPLLMVFWLLLVVLNSLPMVYRSPYPRYIEPPGKGSDMPWVGSWWYHW